MPDFYKPGKIYSTKDFTLNDPTGKFFQMGDTIFYVLYKGREPYGKTHPIVMYIRELLNEEISGIVIRSIPNNITYRTKTSRPGAEKSSYSDIYLKALENPLFKALDLEARVCLYKGNYICKDMKNGVEYSFAHSTRQVKTELLKTAIGTIVSVCRFQNIDFFLASYKYGEPEIKNFNYQEPIILKKGAGFKLTTAEITKTYWARSLKDYNYEADNSYPPKNYTRYGDGLKMYVCEEAKVSYGYASSIVFNDKIENIFVDMTDNRIYSIPRYKLREEDRDALNKGAQIVKVCITRTGDCLAHIIKRYPTKIQELSYCYEDNGKACCMDIDSYEFYEIPMRYLPKDAEENDILLCSIAYHEELKAINPSGKVFVLEKV